MPLPLLPLLGQQADGSALLIGDEGGGPLVLGQPAELGAGHARGKIPARVLALTFRALPALQWQ